MQDLVPYFQENCSLAEVIRWIPTLTPEEVNLAERYYRHHQRELDEEDRLIRERSASRKNPPHVETLLVEARAKRLALMETLRKRSTNGEAK